MSKLKLDMTLIAVTGVRHGETISSLKKCINHVEFSAVKLLTNIDIEIDGVECINVGGLNSVQDYSKFIIKELYKYFDTSHCLIVQHDSWILSPESWEVKFLNYDIVGAPGIYVDGRQNLNGGFAIRSHKLQKAIALDNAIDIFHPCDEVISRLYRLYLIQKYDIKFCPDEIAERFSFELREPIFHTFGFHNFHWQPYKPHVVIDRQGAMGDLIMAVPVMDYYNAKGYQVVVNTQPELMHIFFNHPYRIKHISELNPNLIPEKIIDLNMSYESKPKQRVLETYYEFAGIKHGEIRNSRLYVNMTPEQRLFKKYIVFHIDNTAMPHRNSYGVSWAFVAWHFTARLGYTCIQVGKGSHDEVGTYFHTETKELLMYLLNAADAVVAIDSGVAQLSVALGRPTAIMTGSVNLALRYCDFEKIEVIHTDCPTSPDRFCYHEIESTVGKKCEFNENKPNCCVYTEWDVIRALTKLLKLN